MAGAGKKTFTAGDLLYATPDVNDYLMDQMIMTFGGTAARASAIPTPSEGMVTYLTDTNTTNYYDGSTWASLGNPSALELVKTQTVGSAVTEVEITDAFSANYDNYIIGYVGGSGSGSTEFDLGLGATTTGYYRTYRNLTYGNVGTTDGAANASYFTDAFYINNSVIGNLIYLFSPYLSTRTGIYSTLNLDTASRTYFGYLNNATSYTSFKFRGFGAVTLTGGTIYVYGFKKAQDMAKPLIQIDDLVREMTDEEFADYQARQAEDAQRQAELEAKEQARQSALAKLKALGLSDDEIAALI